MNTIYTYLVMNILPSIVAIGIIDYAVMSRWLKCEYCNHAVRWTQFILPTLIEFTLFACGLWLGYSL